MPRNLEADMQTLRTVLEHVRQRDFERAATLAQSTLASGFEHPLLLNVVATRLEQQGRFEESLTLLERALAMSPRDIGVRNALSLCLQRLNRPAEALVHTDWLIAHHPELGFAHANRGNALVALGALAEARSSHERALELEPNNIAALAALASIDTQRGDHAQARQWAERALQLEPGLPEAVLSLAAAELDAGATAQAEMRLQSLILDSRAGALDRARATSLLGDVLDATARYADAFQAYRTCNESLRAIHRRFAADDILDYARALCDGLAHTQEHDWAAGSTAPPPVAEHVFLLGFPRSGTTLLEVLLDGRPNVVSAEEYELLTDGVLRYMRDPADLSALARADPDDLEALRAAYWRRLDAAGIRATGKVFVDKHPLNTLKLPLIAKLFPRARILFARRDPREVVLSCFRRRFKMNAAMYQLLTLEGAADFYAAVMQFARRARALLPLAWRTVRYESLMTDFERETQAICAFLDLPWDAEIGEFGAQLRGRLVATPSTAQLARGLDRSRPQHWPHYRAQLEPVLPVLEPWLQDDAAGDQAPPAWPHAQRNRDTL